MYLREAIKATSLEKAKPYITRKSWQYVYSDSHLRERRFGLCPAKVMLTNTPDGCYFDSIFGSKPWVPTLADLLADDWETTL